MVLKFILLNTKLIRLDEMRNFTTYQLLRFWVILPNFAVRYEDITNHKLRPDTVS